MRAGVGFRASGVRDPGLGGFRTVEVGGSSGAGTLCFTLHVAGVEGIGCWVQGSGSRVQGSGSRVQGPGFRVQGSGLRVQGLELRIRGLRFRV